MDAISGFIRTALLIMNAIDAFVSGLFDSPLMLNSVFVLFSIIAIGLIAGRIMIYGVSLGSAAVMFVALIYGHYGVSISQTVTSVGLVLFVYCVGIGAGSRFFSTLKQSGVQLAMISCAVICAGGISAALAAKAFGISPSVAAGIFAGALTSTPGLAAAQEHFTSNADQGLVSAGYAIAYPFGVVGTVLFVQLWPRLRKKDLQKIGEQVDAEQSQAKKILPVLVRMTNPKFVGRTIDQLRILDHLHCRITRTMKDGVLVPLEHGATLELDQILWVVGREDDIEAMLDALGEREEAPVIINSDMERRTFVVTNRSFANKSLSQLRLLRDHGVSVSRIRRYEYEIIPNENTELSIGDQLVTVGNTENLEKFSKTIGHRPSIIDATDLLSLTLGIAVGVLVGMIPLGGFKLGLAGGPLLVSLLLGHFGRIGAVAGYVPRPTRLLLRELGLCLFLAGAGIKGGASFVETLQSQGMGIFVVGIIATLVPIIVGYTVATLICKFDILTSLGGVCGAMTSTPALGAISSKTDSQVPIVSYASAYPAALLLMVVGVNLLMAIMNSF
jgi:putative transport protein